MSILSVIKNFLKADKVKDDSQDIVSDDVLRELQRNGLSLKNMQNQNEAMCIVAVKQNGLALQYVKDQTELICCMAIAQNEDSIAYIRDPELKRKLENKTGKMLLHPDSGSIDDLIEDVGKSNNVKPPSGGFAEEMKSRGR